MSKKKISASFTAYGIVNEKNKKIGSRVAERTIFYNDLLLSCNIGLSTVILEKNIVLDNKIKFPELITKEDFVFWLMILKKNYKFYAHDKYLTNWTDLENSLSSSTMQKLKDGFKVYNQYMNFNIIKSLYYLICLSINYLKKK